ncbi:MAG: DMT family transporter [Desulfococcaceae bacterium]
MIYLKLMLTAFFWGGTFVAGRMLSGHVPPCSAAFLRFALAATLLLILTRMLEGKLPLLKKEQILPVILLGLTGVFSYNILFFKGLELISAGRASLIIAMNPICITLFSVLFFREKPGFVRIGGILLSVCGAVVVISKGDLGNIIGSGLGRGEVFIFGCVASWVTFSLIGRSVLTGLSPLVSICYSSIIGAVALFFPAYSEGVLSNMGNYAFSDWMSIAYLGIFGTVIGFIWYYQGIRSIGPVKAGLFINFVPISAIFLAFLILKEPLTFSLLTGAILVVSGVYLTNTGGIRRRVKAG